LVRRRTHVLELVHADDKAQVLSSWRAAQAASASSGGAPVPASFTSRWRRTDGSYCWCQSACFITPARFYGATRDINDRKALEVKGGGGPKLGP
jgi:PAS domain-containing protein